MGIAGAIIVSPLALGQQQDDLKITLNDGFKSGDALRFDWPAFKVGTGQYEAGPTGVTVFHFPEKALAAVDVRGGAPGTVNEAWLDLGYDAAQLDAIVFAGGSWYGLEAITGVATALKDDGKRSGNWDNIALSVGSIVYDFSGRRLNEIYPDKRLAQAAYRAAEAGVFPRGAYGAGRSTSSGNAFGCGSHAGQGGAFKQIGNVKIAAFTIVNAVGVVTDREGRPVGCERRQQAGTELKTANLMREALSAEASRMNTTISLVVVNQKMSPADLKRLAVQVHTSMARGIQPFATRSDGDVLYAVSTGEIAAPAGEQAVVDVGRAASELMWDAIISAIPPQPAPAPQPTGYAPSAQELRAVAGLYRFSDEAQLRISVVEGRLMIESTGSRNVFGLRPGNPVEASPVSKNLFVWSGRNALTLQFEGGGLVLNPGRWSQTGSRVSR